MTVVMFTKMLKRTGGLPLEEAGEELVRMGFDGADLTVRPGGYVEPEASADELADAIGLLRGKGLSVPMLTTSITSADDVAAEEIFDIAAANGVEALKLGYWHYDGFGNIQRQIDACREDLAGIYDLSKEYDVTPALHIHSGDHLTAEAAVVWELLRDFDPAYMGAYLDPGHMTLEGGRSGWEIGLDLLQEYATMVAVKNFGWKAVEGEDDTITWEFDHYPVADGIAPFDEATGHLLSIGFDGIWSIHSEYYDLEYAALAAQTERDLAYLQGLLGTT